ncbi:acyl-coenzyme A thioesterase 13 [Antrostomus carolinensis]|uniref:acyl-coenzyme A thioesterase 13 n=1 Tax=Antrostomus carolinensis TaxID=279965 RepID=UPI0010A98BE8|nr:acyl-coenzyme A thioesterase 13 [Antrostomus carolinensis]
MPGFGLGTLVDQGGNYGNYGDYSNSKTKLKGVQPQQVNAAKQAPTERVCGVSSFTPPVKLARSDSSLKCLYTNTRSVGNEQGELEICVQTQGFDLSAMKLLSAAPGKIVCEMKVEEEHTNRGGTLHGGLTATLVDVVSTAALLYTERAVPGVSVDMNITYTSAAKIGEEILITAQILKQGRNLAFASVDLTNKASGKLIAQGRHTKYLGN